MLININELNQFFQMPLVMLKLHLMPVQSNKTYLIKIKDLTSCLVQDLKITLESMDYNIKTAETSICNLQVPKEYSKEVDKIKNDCLKIGIEQRMSII